MKKKLSKQIVATMLLLALLFSMAMPAFAAYSTGTYKVNTSSGVNVRNGAGSSYTLVGAAVNGTQFSVSKISGSWGYTSSIKCTNGTQSGWVSLDYCSLVSSSSGSSGTTTTTTTTTGYSPAKAIEFAAKYAKSSEVGWLCAEFVSRCLIAGGLNIDNYAGCTSLDGALTKINGVTKSKLQVESSGAILESKNKGKIVKGDVIILHCGGCTDGKPYWHTVLVGDITTSGIKVYARNNSYKNELYYGFDGPCSYCGSSKITAYGYHFNTSASSSTSTPTPAAKTTITFSSITAPTTHTKGNTFTLSGTVKSTNSKLTSLTAAIINSSGSTVVSKTVNPNAYSYTIKNSALDNAMTFGTLSVGSYTLKYTAKTADGTSKTHTSSFTVKAASSGSTTYKLTGNQAADVIGVAESKLGETRTSLGYNADYCAYFVCDVLKAATGASFATKGYPDEAVFAALKSSLKGTYYVFEDKQYNHQDLVNSGLKGTSQVQRVNRSSITPKKGDVIIYLWTSDKNAGYTYSHTGFVKSYSNGTVYTIEGNTTSGSSSGVVANKTRSYDSQVVGIYRPAYKTASTPTPSYPKTLADGVYYIASALDHQKVLDITNGSLDDKANLQLWELNTTAAQRFRIKWENGYYTITNVNSNKALDYADSSAISDASVQQYTPNNTDAQKWSIVNLGNGYYSIRAKHGLFLVVQNGNTANGTAIRVDHADNTKAQMFKFIPESECTPMPCSISFSPTELTLYEGETKTVTINFKGNGIYKLGGGVASAEVIQSAKWLSVDYNTGIAKIEFTAKAAGSTYAVIKLLDSNLNVLHQEKLTITVKSKSTPTPQITPTPTAKPTPTPTAKPTSAPTPKPLTLAFSTNAVTMNSAQTKNVTVGFTGEKVNNLSVSVENPDVCDASIKSLNVANGSGTICLNAKCAGTTRITVSLLDASLNVLLEKAFTVTVNAVDVSLNLSPSSLNLKTGESKIVTINYSGSGIFKLSSHVSNINICSATWVSAMDGEKSTFKLTALQPGKTTVVVSALDANKEVIYQTTLNVVVSNPSTPTPKPTATPTIKPTVKPTVKPTATPTIKPTAKPTPTVKPTVKPPVVGTAPLKISVNNPYPVVGETITVTVSFNDSIPEINVLELKLPIDLTAFEIVEHSASSLLESLSGTTSTVTFRPSDAPNEVFFNWVNVNYPIPSYSEDIFSFKLKVKESGKLSLDFDTSFATDGNDNFIELTASPIEITCQENGIALKDNSSFTIDREQRYLLVSGHNTFALSSLLDNLSCNNTVVTDLNGEEVASTSDCVGTGFKVIATDGNGNICDELTIIVLGDTNGDGRVNSRDIATVQRTVAMGSSISEIAFVAADTNSDSKINSRDVAGIQRIVVR